MSLSYSRTDLKRLSDLMSVRPNTTVHAKTKAVAHPKITVVYKEEIKS